MQAREDNVVFQAMHIRGQHMQFDVNIRFTGYLQYPRTHGSCSVERYQRSGDFRYDHFTLLLLFEDTFAHSKNAL